MRTLPLLAALTVGAALLATPATGSEYCDLRVGNRCAHGGPEGRKCAFNSTTNVTTEAGWQVGDVNAGPLHTGAPGTLHCKIVVNGADHSSPAAVDVAVRDAGGVVATAQRVDYRATAADYVTLCTSWVPDSGPALYWVSAGITLGTHTGRWDTDPSSSCSEFWDDPNDPWCPIWLAADQRLGTNIAEIWQDCESSEPII